MRGLRSFLLLLVVGAGLGALPVLRRVEARSVGRRQEGQGLHRRSGQDRRADGQVGVGRADDAQEDRHRLADRRSPSPRQPDGAAVSGLTSNLSTLELQRVIDENPPDLAEYGLAQPRIEVTFKAGGQEHRLQIGRKTPRGDRPLRQARRSEARLPDSRLRRHARSTRRRSTCATRPSSSSSATRSTRSSITSPKRVAAVRQGRRRVADDAAGARRAPTSRPSTASSAA